MPFYSRDNQALTPEVNWNDPLNRGLVAWWPFRQKGGDTLRDVVGENHGTLESSMTQSDWVASPETKSLALDFDGTDDYVQAANTLCPGKNRFAVECWLNADASLFFAYCEDLDGGTTSTRFSVGLDSSGYARVAGRMNDGDSFTVFAVGNVNLVGTGWHHIVGQVDFTTGSHKVFVDGVNTTVTSSGTSGGAFDSADSNTQIALGFNQVSSYSNGKLASVRVYDRALSESEVWSLYQASRQGYPDQFRQRSTIVTSFAAPTDVEPVAYPIIRTRTPRQVQPSYKSGYARNAAESAYPELWDGLVGAWMPMMGPTGDTLYDLVGINNGTLTNMDPGSDWVIGQQATIPQYGNNISGYALSSDGTDDYIQLGNPASGILDNDGDEPMTVSCVVNPTTSVTNVQVLMAKMLSSGTFRGWTMWLRGSSASTANKRRTIAFILRHDQGTSEYIDVRTPTNLWAASWGPQGFAATYDGSRSANGVEIYYNGESQSLSIDSNTLASAGTCTSSANANLMARDDGNSPLDADAFFGATIHKRVLSQREINILHRDPLAPFRTRSNIVLSSADPAVAGFNAYWASRSTRIQPPISIGGIS